MPLKKSGAMRLAGIAAATCSAFAMTPGAALAADAANECEYQATVRTFAFLGDQNEYFTAPGGRFEGSLTWAASGAVAHKPAPFAVLGRRIVGLGAGGSIQSPEVCVDVTRRHLRFAVKAPAAGTLRVDAVDAAGAVSPLGTIDAATQRRERSVYGWSVSPMVGLATSLGVTSGSRTVQLRITAVSGTWDLDSVEVDPYRS